jgi:hypothetical protein
MYTITVSSRFGCICVSKSTNSYCSNGLLLPGQSSEEMKGKGIRSSAKLLVTFIRSSV